MTFQGGVWTRCYGKHQKEIVEQARLSEICYKYVKNMLKMQKALSQCLVSVYLATVGS